VGVSNFFAGAAPIDTSAAVSNNSERIGLPFSTAVV
jgi:hypothetical protein